MKIIRQHKIKNGGGSVLIKKEIMDILFSGIERNAHFQLINYFQKITIRPDNGRYMIKKQSLKYCMGFGWNKIAYRKTYFVCAIAGISFTLNKKDCDIFYTNNWSVACKVAKMLSTDATNELVSIVDRKQNGKETYVLNKTLKRATYNIIVK